VITLLFISTINAETIRYIDQLNPLILIICILTALGLHILSWCFWALRIKLMAKSMGDNISFKKTFGIVRANLLIAAVTPSQMGGEPIRIKMLAEGKLSGGDATAITLGERVIDAIFLLIFTPIFILIIGRDFDFGNIQIYFFTATVLLLSLGIILFILVKYHMKFKKHIYKFEKIIHYFVKDEKKVEEIIITLEREFEKFAKQMIIYFTKKKKSFAIAFTVTCLMWLSEFAVPSILLIGFSHDPMWVFSIGAQIIIMMISMIPITPGSSGIAEFIMGIVYYSKIPNFIGLFVLIWRAIVFYINIIVGYLSIRKILIKK